MLGGYQYPESRLASLARHCRPTLRYWMETEVHVHALSVAASVLLSFFPFLIVMLSLCHDVLAWRAAEESIYFVLKDLFPDQMGGFIVRNLRFPEVPRKAINVVSLLLLLITANGIFEPLEVALNRAWGQPKNRSYFRNQLISLGLIFACGALALASVTLTAWRRESFGNAAFASFASTLSLKLAAVPLSILALFLIYWLLPNFKVSPGRILPAAVVVGLALEVLKNVNFLTWPWLRPKLQREYGPFVYSVTIVLWSFLAAMLVLAGAEWAARRERHEATKDPIL